MRVETLAPDPRLSHLVRSHQSRTASMRGDPVRLPLPARTDVLIEFYFTRPHLVEHQATGRRERTAWAVAVGRTLAELDSIALDGLRRVAGGVSSVMQGRRSPRRSPKPPVADGPAPQAPWRDDPLEPDDV